MITDSSDRSIDTSRPSKAPQSRRLLLWATLLAATFLAVMTLLLLQVHRSRAREQAIAELERIGRLEYDLPDWIEDSGWLWDLPGSDFLDRFEYVDVVQLLPDEQTFNRKFGGGGRSGLPPYADGRGTTDEDLALLKHFRKLEWLVLWYTDITDAGLVHLKPLKSLRDLSLYSTNITDAGLVHLSQLKHLETLGLGETQVGDPGLVHLSKMTGLTELGLAETRVTGAGLVYLKQLPNLTELGLSNTEVDDAGLMHLKHLKKLQEVCVSNTQVTEEGKAALKRLLPQVKIVD